MEAFVPKFSKDINSSRSKKKDGALVSKNVIFPCLSGPSARPSSRLSLKATFDHHIKIPPLTLKLLPVVKASDSFNYGPPSEQTVLLSCAYPVEGGPASAHFRNLCQTLSNNINSMGVNLDELLAALKYMEACLSNFFGTLDSFICTYYGDPVAIDDFHRLIDRVRDDVINITKSAMSVAMSRVIGGMCMSSYDVDCSIQMVVSQASNKIKEGEKLVNRFLAPFSGSDQCYYEFLDHFDELAIVIGRETIILDRQFFPSAYF